MRQLTTTGSMSAQKRFSKLPMRQLTDGHAEPVRRIFSKLPMRQLTRSAAYAAKALFSKLPMRQLTVVFCANILMLLKLAAGYPYLTKILDTCQSP